MANYFQIERSTITDLRTWLNKNKIKFRSKDKKSDLVLSVTTHIGKARITFPWRSRDYYYILYIPNLWHYEQFYSRHALGNVMWFRKGVLIWKASCATHKTEEKHRVLEWRLWKWLSYICLKIRLSWLLMFSHFLQIQSSEQQCTTLLTS